MFFGGCEDVEDLRRAGVPAGDPGEYRGIDGVWMDVPILLPGAGALSLAFTKRISPAGEAKGWPPSLAEEHPNGVVAIESVQLTGEVAPLEALMRCAGLILTENDGPPRLKEIRFATRLGSVALSAEDGPRDELPTLRPS